MIALLGIATTCATSCINNWVTMAASYSYKVKITNPVKKSSVLIREIYFLTKFDRVPGIRVKLSMELKDQVPSGNDFHVGYCNGPHHSKVIVMSNEEL